jgi:hypothetical protein
MSYARDWILNVVCAKVAERYVLGALPIEAYANRMSRDLLLTYADCTPEKLYSVAENMLFFLAEIEDDNALEHCHSFAYRSVHFDKADRPRRLKGLFLDPLAAVKQQTSSDTVFKSFRAFVFRSRVEGNLVAPIEWKVRNHKEIISLADILDVEVSFSDAM